MPSFSPPTSIFVFSSPVVPKWLLLTQIQYRRDPSTAPQWTSEQILARDKLKQVELAEQQGNISLAIKLYQQAYKLDPNLE